MLIRIYTRIFLVVVFASALFAQDSGAKQTNSALGFIQDWKEFDSGGCSLWLTRDRQEPGKRYVFLSDFDGRGRINFAGQDVDFKLVQSSKPQGKMKVGDRSTFRYRGDKIEVLVEYRVSSVCPPNDEACEVWGVTADVTVTDWVAKTIRFSAWGICGV
jgi:hypothetical protein